VHGRFTKHSKDNKPKASFEVNDDITWLSLWLCSLFQPTSSIRQKWRIAAQYNLFQALSPSETTPFTGKSSPFA